ncbi:MAG: hypothetical protein IKL80_03275, partial [Clostridia bacterium]|nr:hypothetical protein [Clostridia bacterium]
PNDIDFTDEVGIYVLTGPNRGGKSVITCAIGLSQVMMQLGMFVPADEATISPADARYINEITQSGMMAVRREAEKLAAYSGERTEITRADIDLLVMPAIEGKVFDMVAAMLRKDAETAMKLLEDLFALKTDANQILAAVIYNADKLLQTKVLLETGADKGQIMSKLKISPFAASKFMKDSAKYSIEQLKILVNRLAETDGYIKSNSMDNSVLISLLVLEFS